MSDDDTRARVREIEDSVKVLKAQVPEPEADAGDAVDAAQNLQAREELLGQIEDLEAERERLLEELGESGE
jgi:chromosome segregation ATPase